MKLESLAPSRRAPGSTSVLLVLLLLLTKSTIARADAVSELASFSIFDNVDLAQLAKSDVKTAHGPPMGNPRFLSTQSCFVSIGSPAQQVEALRKWNPTKHRELKVFLHSDLPANPTAANFSKLQNAPGNSSVRSLVSATQKLSPELQISKDEAKKFSSASGGGGGAMPAAVVKFWSDVMAARTHSFSSGGTSAQPPYDHGGQTIRAGDDLNERFAQTEEKIRRQFSSLGCNRNRPWRRFA
jgi:hypothetical protein